MERHETVFRVAAEGVELELAGSTAFVERHLELFRPFLKDVIGFAHVPQAMPGEAPIARVVATEAPSGDFAAYAATRSLRDGKGGIQDRLLLAFWFMEHHEGKSEIGTEDITWCFRKAGWELPKSLHNHLGTLKRQKGLLDEGGKRGSYRLSEEGRRKAEVRWR